MVGMHLSKLHSGVLYCLHVSSLRIIPHNPQLAAHLSLEVQQCLPPWTLICVSGGQVASVQAGPSMCFIFDGTIIDQPFSIAAPKA